MPLDRCKLSGIPFAASYAANKARAGSRAPNRQTTPHAAAPAAAAHRRSRWYGKFRNIAIGTSPVMTPHAGTAARTLALRDDIVTIP